MITGVINEYDADWRVRAHDPGPTRRRGHRRRQSFSTGTPLGIGVTPDGTIYYADIGIVNDPENGFGPGDGTGSFRRITFLDGEPQPPETLDEGLAFPDGVGIYVPGGAAGGGGGGSSPV